jgi:hypothetical protein
LLALFVEQLVPTVYNHGIFYAICDVKGGWTPPLVILYYVRCAAPLDQAENIFLTGTS